MTKKRLLFIIIIFTTCAVPLLAMNNDQSAIELDTIENSNRKRLIIIEDNTQNDDVSLEIIPKFQMNATIKKKREWQYACCKNAYDDPKCMEERFAISSRSCMCPTGYAGGVGIGWSIHSCVAGCKDSTSHCSFTDPQSYFTPCPRDESTVSSLCTLITWANSIGAVTCATIALCSFAPWFRGDRNGNCTLNCIRKVKIKQPQLQELEEEINEDKSK